MTTPKLSAVGESVIVAVFLAIGLTALMILFMFGHSPAGQEMAHKWEYGPMGNCRHAPEWCNVCYVCYKPGEEP